MEKGYEKGKRGHCEGKMKKGELKKKKGEWQMPRQTEKKKNKKE